MAPTPAPASSSLPAPRAAARPYEQTVDVETPELVVLTYSIAGVGSRVLAALTDLVICISALLVLFIALAVLASSGRFGVNGSAMQSWGWAILVLAQFAVLWGYYVLFEGLM